MALPKLVTPVLCMHLMLDSLYYRTYFLSRHRDQRKEQTNHKSHPLTIVKEKIKPSTLLQSNTSPTRSCFPFSRKGGKNYTATTWKYGFYSLSGYKMKN